VTDALHEDRRLISKCLKGDREASERFVRRFSGIIYHTVRDTLNIKGIPFTQQDLEDLHNTIFLRLFEHKGRKLGQYQGKNGCRLDSYIRVVAVRILLNHIRDSKTQRAFDVEVNTRFEDVSLPDRESLAPLDLMEQAEQSRLLMSAVDRLPPRDRLFMKLHLHEGLGLEEVADALGISVQNAYAVKHRAVQRLRLRLNDQKK